MWHLFALLLLSVFVGASASILLKKWRHRSRLSPDSPDLEERIFGIGRIVWLIRGPGNQSSLCFDLEAGEMALCIFSRYKKAKEYLADMRREDENIDGDLIPICWWDLLEMALATYQHLIIDPPPAKRKMSRDLYDFLK